MSSQTPRVVVVGAGIAAARAIGALRRLGFAGAVTLVGAERHLPYDRPPLSKAVLAGDRDTTDLGLDPVAADVEPLLGVRATALDLEARVVATDSGDLGYDGLVLATGSVPVRLRGPGEQLVLRTVDDALALRSRLVPGARVCVIGASWIGAEVVTAAIRAGCRVTCVEAGPAPLAQALGPDVGRALLSWWDGVDLRPSTAVDEVVQGGVRLVSGEVIPADVVLTGVGVRPATAWLVGSGLELDPRSGAVVVDERLVASAPGIVAVGDVATRWSPRAGRHLRLEHWDEAGIAPAVGAASLLVELGISADPPAPHDPVPYFWSDQFGHKIQYVGAHGADDELTVEAEQPGPGEPAGPGLCVTWQDAAGVRTAWLGVDRMRELVGARRSVGAVPVPG